MKLKNREKYIQFRTLNRIAQDVSLQKNYNMKLKEHWVFIIIGNKFHKSLLL